MNYLIFMIHVYIFAHAFIMIAMLLLLYATVLFVQFNQLNMFIFTETFNVNMLNKFLTQHTMAFLDGMLINKKFSSILFLYLLFNVPSNLLIVGALLFVKMGVKILLPIAGQIIQQLAHMIIFHLTCATFTKKIHKHSMRLLQISARYKIKSFSCKWKLAFHIEKFHTKNKYGLSYHKYGLITLNSFLKVSKPQKKVSNLIFFENFAFSF